MGIMIERCVSVEHAGWLPLREALWPHCSRAEHLAEMASCVSSPDRYAQFLAYGQNGEPIGLAEASIRTDYVNGATTAPVGFLEALYVIPEARRRGAATQLVVAVSDWAVSAGCSELASDTALENELSQKVHKALGFQETERVVFFRKSLR
jgi:aminoglycoside 6'-N-acetyltransferase I